MPEEPHVSRESDASLPVAPGRGPQQDDLTDELVRQVSDRVYAMLMQDLMIERERQRPSSRVVGSRGGW
jgi:hypothetical protein